MLAWLSYFSPVLLDAASIDPAFAGANTPFAGSRALSSELRIPKLQTDDWGALRELRDSLDWSDVDLNWNVSNPCEWRYVQCTDDGFVETITIRGPETGGITGFLPAWTRHRPLLPKLKELVIDATGVTGELPPEWGAPWKFSNLERLVITRNYYMEGRLPATWGRRHSYPKLTQLLLTDTGIAGTLPGEWGRGFQKLQQLDLSCGRACAEHTPLFIEGKLPAEWGYRNAFPQLEMLWLHGWNSSRQLRGRIPIAWHQSDARAPEAQPLPSLRSLVVYPSNTGLCGSYSVRGVDLNPRGLTLSAWMQDLEGPHTEEWFGNITWTGRRDSVPLAFDTVMGLEDTSSSHRDSSFTWTLRSSCANFSNEGNNFQARVLLDLNVNWRWRHEDEQVWAHVAQHFNPQNDSMLHMAVRAAVKKAVRAHVEFVPLVTVAYAVTTEGGVDEDASPQDQQQRRQLRQAPGSGWFHSQMDQGSSAAAAPPEGTTPSTAAGSQGGEGEAWMACTQARLLLYSTVDLAEKLRMWVMQRVEEVESELQRAFREQALPSTSVGVACVQLQQLDNNSSVWPGVDSFITSCPLPHTPARHITSGPGRSAGPAVAGAAKLRAAQVPQGSGVSSMNSRLRVVLITVSTAVVVLVAAALAAALWRQRLHRRTQGVLHHSSGHDPLRKAVLLRVSKDGASSAASARHGLHPGDAPHPCGCVAAERASGCGRTSADILQLEGVCLQPRAEQARGPGSAFFHATSPCKAHAAPAAATTLSLLRASRSIGSLEQMLRHSTSSASGTADEAGAVSATLPHRRNSFSHASLFVRPRTPTPGGEAHCSASGAAAPAELELARCSTSSGSGDSAIAEPARSPQAPTLSEDPRGWQAGGASVTVGTAAERSDRPRSPLPADRIIGRGRGSAGLPAVLHPFHMLPEAWAAEPRGATPRRSLQQLLHEAQLQLERGLLARCAAAQPRRGDAACPVASMQAPASSSSSSSSSSSRSSSSAVGGPGDSRALATPWHHASGAGTASWACAEDLESGGGSGGGGGGGGGSGAEGVERRMQAEDKLLLVAQLLPQLPDVDLDVDPAAIRYVRWLGSGAFAQVYEGLWTGRDGSRRRVAVKVVDSSVMEQDSRAWQQYMQMFQMELDIMMRISHPNIVRCYGGCRAPTFCMLLLEFMEGGTLARYSRVVRRESLQSCADAALVGMHVATALAFLHPLIVHCDIKPQNILLSADGVAKVSDFGLSKFMVNTVMSSRVGGTPAYSAPEVFRNKEVSEKVDIYSLAMVMWECFTGRQPWSELDYPIQILYQVHQLNERPPIPPWCPASFSKLLRRCWDGNPWLRPGAAELVRKLQVAHMQLRIGSSAAARSSFGELEEGHLD